MAIRLFKNKKGALGFARNWSLSNVLLVILLSIALLFLGNFLLNQMFGIKMLELGTPIRLLLILLGVGGAFSIVIRQQGSLGRAEIFSILIITAGVSALVYYLPILVPEAFSPNSALSTLYNSETGQILYSTSRDTVTSIQSVISP